MSGDERSSAGDDGERMGFFERAFAHLPKEPAAVLLRAGDGFRRPARENRRTRG
jgi:hypothetical protein